MKASKKSTNQNGITIIVLIITIIIMLILLGVTVNTVINGELFNSTGEAVDKTNDKVAHQQTRVDGLMEELTIVEQNQCEHVWGEWVIIKETSCKEAGSKTRECSKCGKIETAEIAPLPHTFENGKCTVCEHELVIGAYIIGYDPSIAEDGSTISTSYTSIKGEDAYTGNGYADQTFKVSNITKWRVIGEEDGQIVIVVADPIQTVENLDFYLQGQAGYVNSISEVDKISGIYGQGKYADISKYNITLDGTTISTGGRSIKIEDVGITQSTIGTSKTYSKNAETGYIECDGSTTSSLVFHYYDANEKIWKSLAGGEEVVITQYNYSSNDHTTKCSEIIKKNSVGEDITTYWVAHNYNHLYEHLVGYCMVRGTYEGMRYGFARIYSSNNVKDNQYAAIRPVVYLKLDVAVSFNEATNTYTIK